MIGPTGMRKKTTTALAIGLLTGVFALSQPAETASRWNFEASDLPNFKASEITTIQRLLRRRGYLAYADGLIFIPGRGITDRIGHYLLLFFNFTTYLPASVYGFAGCWPFTVFVSIAKKSIRRSTLPTPYRSWLF